MASEKTNYDSAASPMSDADSNFADALSAMEDMADMMWGKRMNADGEIVYTEEGLRRLAARRESDRTSS